tara:strand:+ start:164 stop:568 length:405 start_codon:yes stop_codon:yes gene_type:complete
MLDRNMVLGIFLAKGNFVVKIEASETAAIGYQIMMQANVSFRTKEMLTAFSRTLGMLNIQHHQYHKSGLRLGKKSAATVMKMIPETLHYLNPKLSTFKMVWDIVENKEHKTLRGLNRVIEILYGENNGINNDEY